MSESSGLDEIMEFIVNYALALKIGNTALKRFGARLEVNVRFEAPADCEVCVDYVITLRVVCNEKPEACRTLREKIVKKNRENPSG